MPEGRPAHITDASAITGKSGVPKFIGDSLGRHSALISRALRFLIVGLSNTVITYLIFQSLMQTSFVSGVTRISMAQTAGYLGGALWGFYWSRNWAFRTSDGTLADWRKQALRYVLAQIIGLAVSVALLAFFIEGLQWSNTPGWISAMALTTLVNFAVASFWVFGGKSSPVR